MLNSNKYSLFKSVLKLGEEFLKKQATSKGFDMVGAKIFFTFLSLSLFLGSTFASSVDPKYRVRWSRDDSLNKSAKLDSRKLGDFNQDGVKDIVVCQPSFVQIKSGKDSTVLKDWYPSEMNKNFAGGAKERSITGCTVAYIVPGHPSLVISMVYSGELGARYLSKQFILFNDGTKKNKINLEKLAIRLQIGTNSNAFFESAARNVACTKFPKRFLNNNFKKGALCFFAGYDTRNTGPNFPTFTALIKFEKDNEGKLFAKDITAETGLMWSGGVMGTPIQQFSYISIGMGPNRADGLHMMDAAFVDYNSDNKPDLITVGQHASIRISTMQTDPLSPAGIRFTTDKITQAGPNEMTEFLKVQAFDEQNKNITEKCVYISGEATDSLGIVNVYDHIRCYETGEWVKYNLPENFSSEVRQASINRVKGQLTIVAKVKSGNSFVYKYMKLRKRN